jgi:hypothetical protein
MTPEDSMIPVRFAVIFDDVLDLLVNSSWVLSVAMLQFPLHAYSIFTLRASNEKLLRSGNMEQQWGFGQIAAILLLGSNLIVLLNGLQGVLHCPLYNSLTSFPRQMLNKQTI